MRGLYVGSVVSMNMEDVSAESLLRRLLICFFLHHLCLQQTSENVGRIEVQCMMTVTFVLGRIADAPFPTMLRASAVYEAEKRKLG